MARLPSPARQLVKKVLTHRLSYFRGRVCSRQRLRLGSSDRQDCAMLGQRVREVDWNNFPLRVLKTFGAQSHIGFVRYPPLHPHIVVVAVDIAGVRFKGQRRYESASSSDSEFLARQIGLTS